MRFDDDLGVQLGSLSWSSGERSQGWLHPHADDK